MLNDMKRANGTQEMESLAKTPTGIPGFDEISGGGLPRSRTSLIIGGPGSGKTVFALQTLVNGARQGAEPGIFVAFEENSRQIVANAATFGWDLPALEKEKLFFLDARMSPDVVPAGGFDLSGMLASLKAKADQMGARRIVFDSVDVLLSLLDDRLAERREIYRLHDWLSQSGLTGIVTSRVEGGDPLASQPYGYMQFMADCVVLLQHRLVEQVSLRGLRIVKYRGSAFAENETPMVIGTSGVEAASLGMAEVDYPVSAERVSSGIEGLDTMLGGGYYRGTSVLITGAPGTAKSTLGGAFAEAACQGGERTLYVSFDEAASEIVRNLASVGIDLGPHVAAGTLRVVSFRTEARSAEEHLLRLKALMGEHGPRCLVIDPLSAMVKAGGQLSALGVAQRLLYLTKSQGITLVCTSLLEGSNQEAEATPLQISTIADAWIHLAYAVQGGERNRALTIVKSRGTRHSNQVRELILSDAGVRLTDVYTAGGEVLMGTLRWEKEAEMEYEKERIRAEVERKRHELELAEAEAQARMQALKREIEVRRGELARLQSEQEAQEKEWNQQRRDLLRMRSVDDKPPGAGS
jgi:circadian clock protein KaiC